MITSTFNTKTNILETVFKGVIEIEEITDYIYGLSNNKNLPDILKIFTDASNARFAEGVNPEHLKKLVEANYVSISKRTFIYDAFIVSGAMEVALGQLYKEFSSAPNYKFEIFTTKEAAIEWLKIIS